MFLFALGIGALILSKTNAGQTIASDAVDLGDTVVDKIQTVLPGWTTYDALFQKYGSQYSVDWQWLKAFALNESSLGAAASVARGLENPDDVDGSKSSDGKSWGLMQVTLTTARGLDPNATPQKLNDPEYSISLAASYIAQLMGYFSVNDDQFQEWVVKSYNQGPGNTQKEIAGTGGGFANAYWDRWLRNYNKVVA